MRSDLHPLLIAPPIGAELTVRIGERTALATVMLAIGRPVSLPGGERLEVCAPEHLLHLRCGDELLTVRAQDCDLDPAPPAADAALGL